MNLFRSIYRRPNTSQLLRRSTGIALLIGFIFQLGLTPCGCIEHSAWMELLGIEAEHHQTPVAGEFEQSMDSISQLDDGHDCHDQRVTLNRCTGTRNVSTTVTAAPLETIRALPLDRDLLGDAPSRGGRVSDHSELKRYWQYDCARLQHFLL